MKLAFITLSAEGSRLTQLLSRELPGDIYVHEKAPPVPGAGTFGSIRELTADIFADYNGFLYIAPCGVVVRAVAPLLRNKKTDPAIVAIDAGGRYAVSLLSGHEGGANALALKAANIIGAEPVLTTTTEALKDLIVGVGCRKDIAAEPIIAAVRDALDRVQATPEQVRLMATADVKAGEPGIIRAAEELGIPLRIIPSAEIRSSSREFASSDFVEEKIHLPAVAEPAALLAGRRTRLVLPRKTYNGITVAIAREDFPWSESAPAIP